MEKRGKRSRKTMRLAAAGTAVSCLLAAACLLAAFWKQEDRRKESGEIYTAEGYASKLEYPLNENSLRRAQERFQFLYDTYLEGKAGEIYFSIIPDKNYFLAERNGYETLDYEALVEIMRESTPYMEYIDLFDCLELEDYYRSDSHWRQERIWKVAERLGTAMGISEWLSGEFEAKKAGTLKGSYLREEETLPVEADELWYLDSGTIEKCSVYHYLDESRSSVYTLEKKNDRDAYGIFLSGTDPILTIENPEAESGKELVIFRDSFASSLAPLLAEAYEKLTLVDIRYVRSDALANYLTFENQDVLFLYSTLVLNNSVMLR